MGAWTEYWEKDGVLLIFCDFEEPGCGEGVESCGGEY